MTKLIYIKKEEFKILQEILKNFERILVFGSRVKGTHSLFSDLDICIYQNAPVLKNQSVEDLNELFQKSNLPFKVDICVFEKLSEEFKELLLKTSIPLDQCRSL